MRAFCLLLVMLAATTTAIVYTENRDSTLALAVQQPEQSYHVVYFYVCDDLVSVLVINGDEPYEFASADNPAPPEMLLHMIEAEAAGRFYNIEHWRQSCSPNFAPPNPLKT